MTTHVTYQPQETYTGNTTFIRNVLKANALFSGLSGIAFLVGAKPITLFLGLTNPLILTVTGVLLLLFAGDLFFLATRKNVAPKFVVAVIVADALWVAGSIALLATNLVPLTIGGKWAVGIVAAIVALFADCQYFGLRKMKGSQ